MRKSSTKYVGRGRSGIAFYFRLSPAEAVLSALLIIISCCRQAGAFTIAPDVETGAGVDSAYVWRGVALAESQCGAYVAGIDLDGFIIELKGFHELDGDEDGLVSGGMDGLFRYEEKFGRHTLMGGWAGYYYREKDGMDDCDTQEWFAGYAYSPALRPAFRFRALICYDFDTIGGWYGELKAQDTFELVGGHIDMDAILTAGFADDNYSEYFGRSRVGTGRISGKPGMTHVSAMLEFPVMFGEKFAVVPSASYSVLADSRIRDLAEDGRRDADIFAYGLAFRMFF